MANKFLVSVANAILRDATTGAGIAYGIANIDSALTMSSQATEVRGGINNPLLFTYIHDRKVEVKLTNATFDKNILALNAGTTVLNSSITAVKTDCLVLSASGSGTLTATPTSNVSIFYNDTVQTVTPVGATITGAGVNSAKVTAIYNYTVTADQITVETTKPPTVVDLTLIAEERDNSGVIQNYVQINVPKFQVAGNYTLSLAANGVSNQALEGYALAVPSADCTNGEYYAKATWVPATAVAPSVFSIASSPSVQTFSVAAGLPKSKQVTLYGLRGGLYSNIDVTTSASYHVTSGSAPLGALGGYSVGANTGLITAGSNIISGCVAIITACYVDATAGTLTDVINLTATA